MKLLVALGLVVACSPPRAERLERPKPMIPNESGDADVVATTPPRAPKPRPAIDINAPEIKVDIVVIEPDPTHELRWPLGISDHPELAPRFDVAKVLAEPGLDWMGLCKMGAYRRISPRIADQLLYLRAWCAVSTSDYDTALTTLTRLRGSVVPGLAPAVRADLANVIVSSRDENTARAMVAKYGLSGETEVLDRVAATYVEMGQMASATEINELALANDKGTSAAKTCQRLARRVLIDPETYRVSKSAYSTKEPPRGLHDIDDKRSTLFGAKLNADAECHELDAQLSCWLVKSNCAAWYKLSGIAETDAYLVDARAAWPTGAMRANPDAWMRVITPAMNARPAAVAYHYAVLALESAVALTHCENSGGLSRIENWAFELMSDLHTPIELQMRVQRVQNERSKLCWRGD